MEKKDGEKKQIPLRLAGRLYAELAAWAEDEFRSVNGQIEYLLTECVRKRRKPLDANPAPSDEENNA
jgi:hypothetical protein